MKKFILKALLYATPLILVVLAVLLIDPYSLYHSQRDFDQDRYDIGYAYDQGHRHKIFSYLNNPTDKIILGASEINLIHERNIPEEGWHSLSFGGAKLEESIDLFWKIAESNKLSKLLLAPEFIKFYNAVIAESIDYYSWNTTQSKASFDLFNNKIDGLMDKYTLESTYYCLLSSVGIGTGRGKPNTDKQGFWKSQLDYAKQQYSLPVSEKKIQTVYEELTKIGSYCKKEGIEVLVVLPIQQTDLISLEYSDKIYPIYRDYLSHLVDIFGKVYYFDYPNETTKGVDDFSDPFHYNKADLYLQTLWGDNTAYVIMLDSQESLKEIDSLRETICK